MNARVVKMDNSTTVRQLMRPLDVLLAPENVTEVMMNRPGEVWAMTDGEWVRHAVPALTLGKMESLANAIAVFNGMTLQSILSVVLPDGQRGQIVMPPACIDGMMALAIRKHSLRTFTLEEMDKGGVFEKVTDVSFNKPDAARVEALTHASDMTRLDEHEAELLRLKAEGRWGEFLTTAVRSMRNIIVSGKTGSGKTTFARALVQKIPTHERILTIEDVHELILENHPNKFHMLYGKGQGRSPSVDILAANMRLSPDRILLAELRGDEAWDYVSSLNTGHPGSITTTHANSATNTYERVAGMVKNSPTGRDLPIEMIRQVLYTTLDVIVYYKNRRVQEIFYDPIFAKSKLSA